MQSGAHITDNNRIRTLNWLYLFLLVAINVYICRESFFTESTGKWNSMHGEWMALARLRGWNILGTSWWPYGYLGSPVEYVYAPLVPLLTYTLSRFTGGSIALAFHILTGAAYCLGPVVVYLVSWRWARAPLRGLAAGLIYSLSSPAAWILPDDEFQWAAVLAARRMNQMFVWDELPHALSLALLPVAAWLLFRALESEKLRDCVWPVLAMSAMMLDSMFGVVHTLFVLVTVPLVFRPCRGATFARAATVGACAYLLICPWVPPSLLMIVRSNTLLDGEADTTLHTLESLAMVGLAMFVLWFAGLRRLQEGPVRWLALFACPAILIPVIAGFKGPHFVPQPGRYRLEMELAIAWLIPFCLMPLVKSMSGRIRAALLVPLVAAAAWQIDSYRGSGIEMTKPADVHAAVEYRLARWLSVNLPGQRVLMGGSLARGLSLYSDLPQISGPYTTDENPMVEIAWHTIKTGQNAGARDAEYSIAWLKALGVQAIGVPGPRWKPFATPRKFEGILPVLWREGDTTVYRVPQSTTSLAHTLRPDQLVRHPPIHGLDTEELQRYVVAISDPEAPPATFEWQGANHARIRSDIPAGHVVSLQIDYDVGWHARVRGSERALQKDGIGMIRIDPLCTGDCVITLDFDGGGEAKVTRALSLAVLLAMALCLPARGRNIAGDRAIPQSRPLV